MISTAKTEMPIIIKLGFAGHLPTGVVLYWHNTIKMCANIAQPILLSLC